MSPKLIASALVCLLLTFTLSAMAAGTVSSSGTVINVPKDYPTIQAAIDAASAGDTVLVAPGTYYEGIRMKPGVTLQGSGADVTTIRGGSEFYYQGHELGIVVNFIVVIFEADDSIISDFTITGSVWAVIGCFDSSATITNNTITGNDRSYWGILCVGSSPTISNNTITGFKHFGIYCHDSSPTITNNTITGNGTGIVSSYHSSATITNNTITGNLGGISIGRSSATITNNIITGNYYRGISIGRSSATISYNNVWSNGTGYWGNYYGVSAGPSDISVDPLFVDPAAGDYHLQAGSPCIDAGTNDALGLPEADFDGKARIADGDGDGVRVVDMGAFEYPKAMPLGWSKGRKTGWDGNMPPGLDKQNKTP